MTIDSTCDADHFDITEIFDPIAYNGGASPKDQEGQNDQRLKYYRLAYVTYISKFAMSLIDICSQPEYSPYY